MGGGFSYKSPAWLTVRKQCLERDRYRCQIGAKGCTGKATEADHITPWRDDPTGRTWYALDNLRGSCKTCNLSRAARQKWYEGWKRAATHIVLVSGAESDRPLFAHITPGDDDLVIDFDRIAAALAPDDRRPVEQHNHAADIMHEKLVAELTRGDLIAARVWLLTTNPDAAARYPHHEHIDLNPREVATDGQSQGLTGHQSRWD